MNNNLDPIGFDDCPPDTYVPLWQRDKLRENRVPVSDNTLENFENFPKIPVDNVPF